MAVNLTDMDIGTRYALQEDFNNGFVGRDRQVVIQTDDPKGYRPVIMDGATTGGKNKVALVDDLSDYVPVDTYNSEKAGFETTAHASATYATKTELSSYATKSEVTSGLAGKADSSALASYATKTELESKADSSALANYATKTELTSKAPLESPALTGTATLNGQTIATANQIPSVPTLTASQTDLEAGVSELATGTYYFVYE